MLRTAGRAKNLLGDSADSVVNFLRTQINADGLFKDRSGQSDLYYTVFGVEALLALGAGIGSDPPLSYLRRHNNIESLDLVHLASLVRCWADLSLPPLGDARIRERVIRRIETYRSADGGYHCRPHAERGSAYGCFLTLAAYQDLNVTVQDNLAFVSCIKSLQMPDGAYANEPTSEIGSTPATAAALTALHYLNELPAKSSIDWLLSQISTDGGFLAVPNAPLPDLLSTATALHALGLNGVAIGELKELCLDFVEALWDGRGAFRGSYADKMPDCEYTYYALLALGHLC